MIIDDDDAQHDGRGSTTFTRRAARVYVGASMSPRVLASVFALGLALACARLSGLDALVRDECALGCDAGDGGGDPSLPDARSDATPDAGDGGDEPEPDTVRCGAGRCGRAVPCCVTAGGATCSDSGGCAAGAVLVQCDDGEDCNERFTAGGLCCGTPEGSLEIAQVLCRQTATCERPLCDPAREDAGCSAAQTCAPVVPGARVGVCTAR